LSFNEDILAYFVLATILATFSKNWANFSESSGHPGADHNYKFNILPLLLVPSVLSILTLPKAQ
jgi:hypothetical protein